MQSGEIYAISTLHVVIYDNAHCIQCDLYWTSWNNNKQVQTGVVYAYMSNGRAERRVGALKTSFAKMVTSEESSWGSALPNDFLDVRGQEDELKSRLLS